MVRVVVRHCQTGAPVERDFPNAQSFSIDGSVLTLFPFSLDRSQKQADAIAAFHDWERVEVVEEAK